MGGAIRREAWKRAGVAGIALATLVMTSGAASASSKRLDIAAARKAARAAVVADRSYRVIRSTHPLRVRRCWRAPRRAVRCSLNRVAGSPCALDGGPKDGELCAQVLARRTWLVQVDPAAGAPAARILRVVDEP
jgi:hypothetical protein